MATRVKTIKGVRVHFDWKRDRISGAEGIAYFYPDIARFPWTPKHARQGPKEWDYFTDKGIRYYFGEQMVSTSYSGERVVEMEFYRV